jgi:malate synthase
MSQLDPQVTVAGEQGERYDEIVTPTALDLLADLHRRFDPQRQDLLRARQDRYTELASGGALDFLPQTSEIRRDASWRVASPAPGLIDRRVEITGPTETKMAIDALNSGAKVWLADLEDANTPLWQNVIGGQLILRDALDGTLAFRSPDGRDYRLAAPIEQLATIVMRPRGWHLPEKHLLVDGEPMSGSLVDFGLYAFHCARRQLAIGRGPYVYLPKLESHLEARLWNDVFVHTQQALGLPQGTVRATVLIETYPAAFEMDEILYELREHSSGLNAGRWDYLFSVIKKFRGGGDQFVLPDRNAISMTAPFMRAYTELLVHTCHTRGAHAIGGMAAYIPSRRDHDVNQRAMAKVREDKTREANDGFDGSWVAHPDLVPLCREVFDDALGDRPNQLDRTRDDVRVTAADLLDVGSTPGQATIEGLRNDISVGLQYLQSWLGGNGAVAIFNLMEDAATAEIARSQVWQWRHNGVRLADGRVVTDDLVRQVIEEEFDGLRAAADDRSDPARWQQARDLFTNLALADDFPEFLTLAGYERMP